MIAAEAHRPLDRVRQKLEKTFGQFDLQQTTGGERDKDQETLIATLSDAIKDHQLVEIEYWKVGEEQAATHLVEPYVLERSLPYWYVHTWDRTREAQRSFRLDRMRSAQATGETFEPREGFEPVRLRDARVARIVYSPEVAGWEVERGAQELVDGTALMEQKVGSPEWLVSEILRFRGEAVVAEPEDLRRLVASRAKALLSSLGLSRLRVPA
jgi:proteasome accessory factor C